MAQSNRIFVITRLLNWSEYASPESFIFTANIDFNVSITLANRSLNCVSMRCDYRIFSPSLLICSKLPSSLLGFSASGLKRSSLSTNEIDLGVF